MVGLPIGVAVQEMGLISVIDCGKRLALPEVIETVTIPAFTLETANVRVFPVPDNAPFVAEPVPGIIIKSDAVNVPGFSLKEKLIAVVVGLPVGVAVQVFAISVSVWGPLAIPVLLI